MSSSISASAINYLSEREGGMKLTVFDDKFGYATVGLGHLVMDVDSLKLGDTITEERAVDFLDSDLEWACEAVERFVEIKLNQNEFDALVIFCFNIGQTAFKNSTLVRRLNDLEPRNGVVPYEMARWNRVQGKFVRGLYNRRVDTTQMFVSGDYAVDWSGLEGQV